METVEGTMGPMGGETAKDPYYRRLEGWPLASAMRYRPDIPAEEARRLAGEELRWVKRYRPDVAALIGGSHD